MKGRDEHRNKTLLVGNNSYVTTSQVVAILDPAGQAMKRLREEAHAEGRLLEATKGKKTRSIVVTASNLVILSALNTETLANRFELKGE